MSQSPPQKPVSWTEIALLAMLGGFFLFSLVANGRSLLEMAVAIGFGGGLLVISWLWQVTLRRAETAPTPTGRQWAWSVAAFVLSLATVGVLMWWCLSE